LHIKPPENDQLNNADHSQVVLLFFLYIQPLKEIIIGAGVYLLQGNQYADADIQLAGFIFLIYEVLSYEARHNIIRYRFY